MQMQLPKGKSVKKWLISPLQRRGWHLGSLALLLGLGWSQAAYAEGSRDLTDNVGYRPFLEYRGDVYQFTVNLERRSVIRVYAAAGETLTLGSSAAGIGQGTITYIRPDGTEGTCGNQGRIPNRQAEVTGTGYVPCAIEVLPGQEGIWNVEFVSPNPTGGDESDPGKPGTSQGFILARANWNPQTVFDNFVTAWDVTVVDPAGSPILGRVYTNYLSLNLGANRPGERVLESEAFILTDQGFLYRVDLNGLDPFGFIFFANSEGFTDLAGNPLYRSVRFEELRQNLVTFSPPNRLDDPAQNNITYKIFFNPPSPDLPEEAPVVDPVSGVLSTTWLRTTSPPPIPLTSNFQFIGIEGTPGQAGPTLGGNFVFDANARGNYVITIDVNRNDVFGDENDRVLRGQADAGRNTIFWDGLDGSDPPQPVQAGEIPYSSKLSFFIGDVHFPFLDPENDEQGLIIERVDPNNPTVVENNIVYYDDSKLNLVPPPGATNPISALDGVVVPRGSGFTSNFGNENGIDTWTSLATPISLTGGIVIRRADLLITKTDEPDPVVAGNPLSYILNVTSNLPPQGETYTNVTGVPVTDTVPPDVTDVTWTCTIPEDQGACRPTSGTGNEIALEVDLNVGATAIITINGNVSPIAGGTLDNVATVARPPDVTDPNPDNNTTTQTTTVTPSAVQPVGVKSVRLFNDADNSGSLTLGDTVEYTITYKNNSSIPAADFVVRDEIDSRYLNFVTGSYVFEQATGTNTTVTANPNYNGTTDPILNTPGTLGAGGQVVFRYQAVVTAPADTVIVNQGVATFTSNGVTLTSLTDAIAPPGSIPQNTPDNQPFNEEDPGNVQPNPTDDDPTLIRVVGITGDANLRLVKRITNITRGGVPLAGIDFASFTNDPSENDTAPGWSQLPGGAPVGVFNVGQETTLQSGDEVEYTVYFLSDGSQNAQAIKVCDAIPAGTVYSPGSISVTLPSAGLSNQAQTDVAGDDRGAFVPSLNVSPPFSAPPCPDANNSTGAVFVDLGDIPSAVPNNVGFVRFRVRIE